MPIWGGQDFIFFRPVFNFADSAISIGVIVIIIFQNKFLNKDLSKIEDQIAE
jgi:signal peptidase II